MENLIVYQLLYMIRIILALVCGMLLGYERKRQMKTAGITTHAMVASASALMMIISKYGFFDIIIFESVQLDPSRIAAGVVTAISFLGAGVIFNRRMNIVGLTTAAGLWMTVGIGITIGCGLHITGIVTTLMILLMQMIVHSRRRCNKASVMGCIELIASEQEEIELLLNSIHDEKIFIITNISVFRLATGQLRIKLCVTYPHGQTLGNTIGFMNKMPGVVSIKY